MAPHTTTPADATAAAATAVPPTVNPFQNQSNIFNPYTSTYPAPVQPQQQLFATTLPAIPPPGVGVGIGVATATPIAGLPRIISCICQRGTDARLNMVQCTEPSCGIWQHLDCVSDAVTAARVPSTFRCEQCRIALADPYWEPLETLLPIAKLKAVVGAPPHRDPLTGELHPHQSAERAVFLRDAHIRAAKEPSAAQRIQVSCLLAEDTVPCRIHWPRNVTMRVNNLGYRPYGRSTTAKMGINQRDEPANIASLCFAGRNTVTMSAIEGGSWLLALHRARRRTHEEVKGLMKGRESLEESVERVKNMIRGGGSDGSGGNDKNGDDDDDDGILISSQRVSLRDPMSNLRILIPARFTDASGLQAFDLDSFLSLAQRHRKWQDPTTLKNSTIRQLQIDEYMTHVLECVRGIAQVSEIEINDEGAWRPVGSGFLGGGSGTDGSGTDGTDKGWFDVRKDGASAVKTAIEEMLLKSGGGRGGGGDGNGKEEERKAGGVALLSDSDHEETEEEELRKAVAAMRGSTSSLSGGVKRKAAAAFPEVIDLVSDSEDENEEGNQQHLHHHAGQQQGVTTTGGSNTDNMTTVNLGGSGGGGPAAAAMPMVSNEQPMPATTSNGNNTTSPPLSSIINPDINAHPQPQPAPTPTNAGGNSPLNTRIFTFDPNSPVYLPTSPQYANVSPVYPGPPSPAKNQTTTMPITARGEERLSQKAREALERERAELEANPEFVNDDDTWT